MFPITTTPTADASTAAIKAAPPGFTPFARSPLWDLQRDYYSRQGLDAWAEGRVPHYATSHPSIAEAYARMVLGFWRDLKAQGRSSSQPLYIIELGAGSGRFAYHFLLQFFEAFDTVREPEDEICYVMTDFCATTVGQWRQRLEARLQPFVAQGRLDFAVFDAEADSELELQNRQIRLAPGSLALPPVVIANYVFGSLRNDLFFLDKDCLFEGWVAAATGPGAGPDTPFAGLKLDYQRRRIMAPGYPDRRWNELIDSYAKRLPACSLLVPFRALHTLESISRLHSGELLLLSADRGSHALEDLARQAEPDVVCHGGFDVPVNYAFLADLARTQGGSCWTSPAGDGLAILAVCWRAPSAGRGGWRETALAAQQALGGFNPNDFYRIKQALEVESQYLSPEQMLAFLRLSRWDTKVFYSMYAYVYDFLAALPARAQRAWYDALRDIWRFHLPIGEDYDLAFDLGALAAELNRWSAAIDWFSRSLEHINPVQRQDQNLGSIYYNLGIAHWQLADYGSAETCLLRAIKLVPEPEARDTGAGGEDEDNDDIDEEAQDDYQAAAPRIDERLDDLLAWRGRCLEVLGAETLHLPSTSAEPGPVYASLLGPHQAQALYRLQRDPELCRQAGVKVLRSTGMARDWIQREQDEHRHVLAILHRDLGLIGVATLACPPGAITDGGSRSARFYYWIGTDYQHHGYGQQALALLHQLAGIQGMHHLFSTVGQNNMASRRTLAKLGYQRLPFELVGERPGYHCYHVGQPADEPALHGALAGLLTELGSGVRLAPLFPPERD